MADPRRTSFNSRQGMAMAFLAVSLVAIVAAALLLIRTPEASDSSTVARVEVSPAALLLTTPGETRQLSATAYDAAGAVVPGGVTWSTTHQSAVGVSASGLATAAARGSALITATVDGVASQPVLAIVTTPAPGVILVTDGQVTAGPTETNPDAEPSLLNTYEVTVKGVRPSVGDRLIGTGGTALAGEVVAVTQSGNATTATMRLVPLPELLPDLELDETIDLTNAEVIIPDNIARLFEITRVGTVFTFTPRQNFEQLEAEDAAVRPLPVGPVAALGDGLELAAAQGTRALLSDCELAITPSSGSLPIQLAAPPTFTFDVNPSLRVTWTPDDHLEALVASASVKITIAVGLKVTVAFEGKVTCDIELFQFRIPAGGPLSFFIAGLVPVKAGIELSGKVTVATLELGGEYILEKALELGILCPGGGDCSVQKLIKDVKDSYTPKIDGPGIGDVRYEPAIEVFGGLDLAIGNPFFRKVRLDLVATKIGAKLSADWAPQFVQVADTSYASSYKLTLETGATIGTKLGDIANLLGLGSITAAALKISKDLATSPTGTLQLDRDAYVSGDPVNATVTLDPASLTFLGGYQVARVLLVEADSAGVTTRATATAAVGQGTFQLSYPTQGPVSAANLYAFVVTTVGPFDFLALELGKVPPPSPSPSPSPTPTTSPSTGAIRCTGDPGTVVSQPDEPNDTEMSILFTGGSTCAIDPTVDPNDSDDVLFGLWNASPTDGWTGAAGPDWSVAGLVEKQAPGTYTLELVSAKTGDRFSLTFTVDIAAVGPDMVSATFRDVSITPVP